VSLPAVLRRITALEPDPTRPGAVRVRVDGRLFCTVDAAEAEGRGLAVGASWDETSAGEAERAAEHEATWRALLKALERRSFSTAEIRKRLKQKGHPPEAIDHAIDRATRERLLDDRAFAVRYVESRATRGRGPGRLRQDLRALGVDAAVIEAAISAHWPEPEDALALCRQLAEKRARQLGALAPDIKRRRLLAYLGRRGFTGSKASAVIREVLSK
jgi:SOS response regulatory protein OraA/RecX